MTSKLSFLALILCAAGVAAAQETPKLDIFGGYSYGRIKTGSFGPGNLNGWDASVTYNLTPWLGLEAEGSGHYGSHLISPAVIVAFVCPIPQPACPPNFTIPARSADQKMHTFTLGPRFTWRTGHAFTPFAHVLIGAAHANEDIDFFNGVFKQHHSSFIWKGGVGADLRLNSRASWRTQIDFLGTRFDSRMQDSFQVTTGPVFHFGRK